MISKGELIRYLKFLSLYAAIFLCCLHEQTYTVYNPISIHLVHYNYIVNITSYDMEDVRNNISKIILCRSYKGNTEVVQKTQSPVYCLTWGTDDLPIVFRCFDSR